MSNIFSIIKKNWIVLLATLNFTLVLFGYQFIASAFMPIINVTEDSQAVTIPYRALSLGISLFLILFGSDKPKLNRTIGLLLIFWIILLLRFYFDLNFRPFFHIDENDATKVSIFMFGIVLPSSIAYYRSYTKVNYKLALKISILFLATIALMNFLYNDSLFILQLEEVDRISGGIALNSISFGHCGASMALIGLYFILYKKQKLIPIIFVVVGGFILLRSASRGPLFAMVSTMIFLFCSKARKPSLMIIILVLFCLILILFQDSILEWISRISPDMASRMKFLIIEHNSTGRDLQYMQALDIWSESPLIGKYFTLYVTDGITKTVYYSHNIILDAAIQGGIVGVSIMVYFYFKIFKTSYLWFVNHSAYAWIGVILMQRFIGLLTSGSFFYEQIATVGILCVALLPHCVKRLDK